MITAPTPTAATRALRDALQRATSCVTPDVLAGERFAVEGELTLASRLRSQPDGAPIVLSIRHYYAVVTATSGNRGDGWQARTAAYYYTLDDADGREILAYHWHPTGRSPVTLPHLHLGAAAGALRRELVRAHLETGFVTPVALLGLVLEQFGVRPRRADWAAVLAGARDALQPV